MEAAATKADLRDIQLEHEAKIDAAQTNLIMLIGPQIACLILSPAISL